MTLVYAIACSGNRSGMMSNGRESYTVQKYPHIYGLFSLWVFHILTEPVLYGFVSADRAQNATLARALLFRRFTDTNIYGTGFIEVRKTGNPWIYGYFYSVEMNQSNLLPFSTWYTAVHSVIWLAVYMYYVMFMTVLMLKYHTINDIILHFLIVGL